MEQRHATVAKASSLEPIRLHQDLVKGLVLARIRILLANCVACIQVLLLQSVAIADTSDVSWQA